MICIGVHIYMYMYIYTHILEGKWCIHSHADVVCVGTEYVGVHI